MTKQTYKSYATNATKPKPKAKARRGACYNFWAKRADTTPPLVYKKNLIWEKNLRFSANERSNKSYIKLHYKEYRKVLNMTITQKQKAYAKHVASGMDFHTAALKAGCKNHESARKFVADMAKRENVQAHIAELKKVQNALGQDSQNNQNSQDELTATVPDAPNTPKYETPSAFLTAVFNNADGLYTPKERINAAIALLPYTEHKLAQTGKKEDELDNAKNKSENGRFATLSNQSDMFGSELLQ